MTKCNQCMAFRRGIVQNHSKICFWQKPFNIFKSSRIASPLVFFGHIMSTLFHSSLHTLNINFN